MTVARLLEHEMASHRRLFSALVHASGSILLIAGCGGPSVVTANGDSASSPCRCILRLKDDAGNDDQTLRELAASQRVRLESVTELGDHRYRLLFRSHAADDCSTVISRFSSDARVGYATVDERKRTQ